MRKKKQFEIYPLYTSKSEGYSQPIKVTTSGLHAYIGEFNKKKRKDLVGFTVRKALPALLLAVLFTSCVTSYHPRRYPFDANTHVPAKLLGYDWGRAGRVTIHILTSRGDTIHYLTRGSRQLMSHRQTGDLVTFIYDSTKMNRRDTAEGRLIFNP